MNRLEQLIEEENEQIDENIICPYCGYEEMADGDFWYSYSDFEEHQHEKYICNKCEKEFDLSYEIKYIFTTRKINE